MTMGDGFYVHVIKIEFEVQLQHEAAAAATLTWPFYLNLESWLPFVIPCDMLVSAGAVSLF